jgi:hypothetical protein
VIVRFGVGGQELRLAAGGTEVIERVLATMAAACGLAEPSPAWWVTFR